MQDVASSCLGCAAAYRNPPSLPPFLPPSLTCFERFAEAIGSVINMSGCNYPRAILYMLLMSIALGLFMKPKVLVPTARRG